MQTVDKLLKLRNKIAHGKSEKLNFTEIISAQDYPRRLKRPFDPKWIKKLMNAEYVKIIRDDVKGVIKIIHDARPEPKELLFHRGFQFGTGSRLG
tara:strand:- start:159 stop:443 length:285 start_codon:yes stop_codon:yes gene_type:complete